MIKRSLTVALAGLALISFNACKHGDDFQKKDGLEYKIVKDVPGSEKANVGDWVSINIRMFAGDSLLADSRKLNQNKPVEMQLQQPMFRGDWTQGLTMLTPGDSAVFRISVDSLKKALGNQPLPPFMKKAKYIMYEVSMVSIKTAGQYKNDIQQKDNTLLQDYFTKNNIKPTKTASGLFYTMQSEGSGDAAKTGDSVSIKYTGKTLDGNVFDSNTDPSKGHVKPFVFAIGAHEVIPGMEEGVALFKKGGKGTLYIPSALAYGAASPGPGIAPNSILIFDIEVSDIKHP